MSVVMLMVASCGTVYRSSAIVSGGRIDKHRVIAGPSHLTVRFGPEWIELGVRNVGKEPIELDWNAIQLRESELPTHPLREISHVRNSSGLQGPKIRSRPTVEYSFERMHTHGFRRESPSAIEEIEPGASTTMLLYAAEHMKQTGTRTLVGKLFCHSAMQHKDRVHHPELVIPIRYAGRRQVLRVRVEVPAF